MDRKQLGRIGLSMAINYFTIQGYTVSLPINDTQWYDLIVEKDGIFQTVQCKATATENNCIDLRCTGGTKGTVYDHTLNHPIDYLFCVDKDLNMFVIPVKDIVENGSRQRITLAKVKNPYANKNTFDTSKYFVENMGR